MTALAVARETREEVTEVLVRYATGIDQRDWDLFRTCFTQDCQADYGGIGAWHSADTITEWMAQVHAGCGHTMHRITNVVMSSNGDGLTARSYVDSIVKAADNQSGTQVAGYYDDELVNTSDGWKISQRRFTPVHFQTID
ncbi:nuclear transport factor 2 family protein [Parafrankia sp. FMc6]|uniref:nuclear transport factor 2 family protein n=1 Tax=Parafrankia soli TaxID=2599596 RepID=UPI0034D3C853